MIDLSDRLRTAEARALEAEELLKVAVRAVEAERAKVAKAEAVIAEAPHGRSCDTLVEGDGWDCDCWKSRYRAGADHE